jgi:predicted AlkP superfamily pyrophosphatase or phosphodiesterase
MARAAGSQRLLVVAIGAIALAAVGARVLQSPDSFGGTAGTRTLEEMADEIGAPVMEHLRRGHVPGRSGDIMLVPRPHRYLVGEWDLRTLDTANPETFVSHPNPWDYLARVPIIFYGPGVVEGKGEVESAVDVADLAPTYARMLGMRSFEADGTALEQVAGPSVPRLRAIVTIVLDGGGWNTLRSHPHSWPNIHRLARSGTTFANATIGSAPSLTGAIHSTMGTGRYPLEHGIPTNPWLTLTNPATLRVPTVSELWDEATNNSPIVAMTGFEAPHVGMIGHGAQRPGGDRDIAAFWESRHSAWRTNEAFYRLPAYLKPTDTASLAAYERKLDAADGLTDGTWLGHSLGKLRDPLIRPGTPAFARFNGDSVLHIMRNEGIGLDEATDMLWVEMKMPDFAGHLWNMVGPEEGAVLGEVDRQIGRIWAELDATMGPGAYVLVITADHGQEPLPELSGGWRINSRELELDLEDTFGPIVDKVTTLDLQIDVQAAERSGVELSEVAEFIGAYRLGDNVPDGAPGAERVPLGRLGERLFAGAFDTDFLQKLTAKKTTSYGDSIYPEGSFPLSDRP